MTQLRDNAAMKLTWVMVSFCSLVTIFPSFGQGFTPDSVPGFLYTLPAPPSLGDAQDTIDYETVLDYQNKRTPDECARANSEVKIDLKNFYGGPYGSLSADEVTKWEAFTTAHSARAVVTVAAAKLQYHRPRPFVSHSDIHPCVPFESTPSYPSAHSAFAEYFSRILSIAYPERAHDFSLRATQIAVDRNIGGVHYPTDIHAGLSLGDQVFDAQDKDESFENEIRANLN